MARKGKVLQLRLTRIKLSNRLLEWLKDGTFLRTGEGIEGSHTCERIIIPFSKAEGVETWEAWRAWDILLEAGRRKARPGSSFEVVSFKPIVADDQGQILTGV